MTDNLDCHTHKIRLVERLRAVEKECESIREIIMLKDEAIKLAEKHANEWRANANEWRAAMTDREREFFPRMLGNLVGLVSILAMVMAIAGYVK